jgi:hypothetical protein
VRRKGTKAARKLPFDYIDNKHEFLKCAEDIFKKWSISAELVINFDNINFFPFFEKIAQVTNLLYDKNIHT